MLVIFFFIDGGDEEMVKRIVFHLHPSLFTVLYFIHLCHFLGLLNWRESVSFIVGSDVEMAAWTASHSCYLFLSLVYKIVCVVTIFLQF